MSLYIDGPAATETVDSSGEILSLEGCDISDLIAGKGVMNWEHTGDVAEDSCLAKIIYAKKIFKPEDCENERQTAYYKKVGGPYLYVIARFLDEEGHPGAVAVRAMIEYSKKTGERMLVGMSVEGSTLERSGNNLKRTVIKKVSLTLKPCNRQCWVDMLESNKEMQKALGDDKYHPLAKSCEFDFVPYEVEAMFDELAKALLDIQDFRLQKSLSAGMPAAAPGQNTQGSALQKLDHPKEPMRSKIRALIRDKWDKITPIRAFLKAELPDLGDQFKEHFDELIDDLHLRKSRNNLTTSHRHTPIHIPHTKDQKHHIAGLYVKTKNSEPIRTINSLGQRVIVKRGHNSPEDAVYSSHRATAYHNIVRDLFGMGAHVPKTSAFLHPEDRSIHHVESNLGNLNHGYKNQDEYDDNIRSSPAIQKIALMDYVLGADRGLHNLKSDHKGMVHLTDNEKTFTEPNHPEYLHLLDGHHKVVSQEIKDWISGINDKELIKQIRLNGLPKHYAKSAALRLAKVKQKLASNSNLESIYED